MTERILELCLVALLLTDIVLVASSRLMHCIRIAALQGLIVGALPLLSPDMRDGAAGWTEAALLAALNISVKAALLPYLLGRATRLAKVRREIEPFIGYTSSTVIAALMTGAAFWICARLPLPREAVSPFALPAAVSTLFIGLFVIVSRKKAITQAIGFLVFENGICVFGMGLLAKQALLVELGILLDVLALIFIMGIAVFHISHDFEHIDTDRMNQLADGGSATEEAEA